MIIFLLGFMGAGKTTIGRDLANSMNFKFIDLDEYIEKKENSTVFDIFNKKGEKHFRHLEHYSLKELILLNNIVIATGGGTPCFFDNISIMNKYGLTIYINVDYQTLLSRIKKTKDKRPLLKNIDDKQMLNFITKKVTEREIYYKQSKKIVNYKNLSIDKLKSIIL
tara:strand:- start:313 stop:810 length:498 start_codon:yes stop_codon:yes gene_type:complete